MVRNDVTSQGQLDGSHEKQGVVALLTILAKEPGSSWLRSDNLGELLRGWQSTWNENTTIDPWAEARKGTG